MRILQIDIAAGLRKSNGGTRKFSPQINLVIAALSIMVTKTARCQRFTVHEFCWIRKRVMDLSVYYSLASTGYSAATQAGNPPAK